MSLIAAIKTSNTMIESLEASIRPLDAITNYFELCAIETSSPHLLNQTDLSSLFNKHEISVFFDVSSPNLMAKCGGTEPPLSDDPSMKPNIDSNMDTDYIEIGTSRSSITGGHKQKEYVCSIIVI